MKWYYFQTKKDGPIIRVMSQQKPKAREQSYIVHEYDPKTEKYSMACFPEIYGGRLLKMIFVGSLSVSPKKRQAFIGGDDE